MAEKQLYILAGYDAETEERLNAIQNALYADGFTGTQTKGIPMHITMGCFPTDGEDALKEHVRNVAAKTAPWEIEFSHAGLFAGANVLFIAPDCSERMLRFKDQLQPEQGWTPHNTVLIDTPETVYRALPKVMEMFRPFRGTVTKLYLYEFWPTRHILTAELGKDV